MSEAEDLIPSKSVLNKLVPRKKDNRLFREVDKLVIEDLKKLEESSNRVGNKPLNLLPVLTPKPKEKASKKTKEELAFRGIQLDYVLLALYYQLLVKSAVEKKELKLSSSIKRLDPDLEDKIEKKEIMTAIMHLVSPSNTMDLPLAENLSQMDTKQLYYFFLMLQALVAKKIKFKFVNGHIFFDVVFETELQYSLFVLRLKEILSNINLNNQCILALDKEKNETLESYLKKLWANYEEYTKELSEEYKIKTSFKDIMSTFSIISYDKWVDVFKTIGTFGEEKLKHLKEIMEHLKPSFLNDENGDFAQTLNSNSAFMELIKAIRALLEMDALPEEANLIYVNKITPGTVSEKNTILFSESVIKIALNDNKESIVSVDRNVTGANLSSATQQRFANFVKKANRTKSIANKEEIEKRQLELDKSDKKGSGKDSPTSSNNPNLNTPNQPLSQTNSEQIKSSPTTSGENNPAVLPKEANIAPKDLATPPATPPAPPTPPTVAPPPPPAVVPKSLEPVAPAAKPAAVNPFRMEAKLPGAKKDDPIASAKIEQKNTDRALFNKPAISPASHARMMPTDIPKLRPPHS